jgi:hypothetical protein
MEETVQPLDRNRLSVLVAVLLLGNVLFRFIQLPEHVWRLQPLGSPLEVQVTGTWLLVALMVGLVCTGTNLIIHDHPYLLTHPRHPVYVSWILPGLTAGLSAYLLALVPSWPIWVAGLIMVAVAISLTISAEYAVISTETTGYAVARLALNVLAYLLAFAFFVIIYQTRTRSLVTATVIVLVGFLVALNLLSGAEAPFRRVVLFASVAGFIVGESTWALNYWQISDWAGGLFLLLVFYIVINVAHQHLLERLSVSTVVELAIVTAVILTFVILGAP